MGFLDRSVENSFDRLLDLNRDAGFDPDDFEDDFSDDFFTVIVNSLRGGKVCIY